MDPNYVPVPIWELVGVSLIFLKIIETRSRQGSHFFINTCILMEYWIAYLNVILNNKGPGWVRYPAMKIGINFLDMLFEY